MRGMGIGHGPGGSEFMKSFDWKIVKRLLSYLKAYQLLVLVAMLALVISTVVELAAPVVLQRTIDRHITGRYLSLDTSLKVEEGEVRALYGADKGVISGKGSFLYLSEDFVSAIPGNRKKILIESGALSEVGWLLLYPESFPRDNRERAVTLLRDKAPDLRDEENFYAITEADYSRFSPEEKLLIRSRDRQGIIQNGWIYLALLASSLIFSFLQNYFMTAMGQNVMRDLRLQLLRHLMKQSLSYLQKTPVGSLVSRLTSDVDTINELFSTVVISLIKDVSMMAGVIVTLYLLNGRLTLITLLTLPPVILFTLYFRVKAREAYRLVRSNVASVNAFLSEHISGMEVVQMFGREQTSRDEFDERNEELYRASLKELYVIAPFRASIDFLTTVSTGVVLYYGAGMFMDLSVSLGVLIAFISLIRMFYHPVMDISEKFTIIQSAMAGGERIFSILDTVNEIPDEGRDTPPAVAGALEFRNVEFSYLPGEQVLKGLSFAVDPGETVAVVGYTGAGKTTIANLLTRFWDIQAGEILVDGRDIRSMPLADLRRVIQPVQQDVFLFSGTIEDNITLGAPVSREKVVDAARMVNAHQFVEKLSGGYDSILQERGSNLSTGQKQLISFARVIAQDPRILILDEATANVDTETEQLIQKALRVLLEGRTSLVIAHRLSTIRNADRILVLSQGRLVEFGSHNELIERKGLYYNLYRLQYSGTV